MLSLLFIAEMLNVSW